MTKLRTHRLFTFVPRPSRVGSSLEKLSLPAMICVVCLFCAATVIAAPAQSVFFTTLASFSGTNGLGPYDGLVQGTDGNFYGTTYEGGDNNICWEGGPCGTVFKITPGGTITSLHSFDGADGAFPTTGLVQASDGNFYGTAQWGGTGSSCEDYGIPGCGTVFKITPSGAFTTMYSFCSQPNCADGFRPTGGLVQANDGNLYGTTSEGGANSANCPDGCGTVFRITPSGTLTTLYSFDVSASPSSTLVQATDGNLYGTTVGTVFKITLSGVLTTLAQTPEEANGLVQATDGNFYGTTYYGGMYGDSGTVFEVTPAGTLTTLYEFCTQDNCTDGRNPAAALVQASDGNFYGTTILGGAYNNECYGLGCGTIFEITPTGALTTLHSFCASGPPCTDGSLPYGALVQPRDGSFYGTTFDGNTVFRLGAVRTCAICRL